MTLRTFLVSFANQDHLCQPMWLPENLSFTSIPIRLEVSPFALVTVSSIFRAIHLFHRIFINYLGVQKDLLLLQYNKFEKGFFSARDSCFRFDFNKYPNELGV